MTLQAQGLIGARRRRGGVPAMLRRLGAVQLDTISVLARSHELVAYARLGAVPRQRIERAYWHPRRPERLRVLVACGLRAAASRSGPTTRSGAGRSWPGASAGTRSPGRSRGEILARLRAEGPLTATQLGGAKNGGPWWDWSETKIGVEWLLDTGEVICVRRTGWRRVYDLPERVLPPELLRADPSDAECVTQLAAVAARALGVVTQRRPDRLPAARWSGAGQRKDGQAISAEDAAAAAGLVPVEIAAPPPPLHVRPGGREADAGLGRPVRSDSFDRI